MNEGSCSKLNVISLSVHVMSSFQMPLLRAKNLKINFNYDIVRISHSVSCAKSQLSQHMPSVRYNNVDNMQEHPTDDAFNVLKLACTAIKYAVIFVTYFQQDSQV